LLDETIQSPYLLSILNLQKKQDVNLKTYLLNTIGSSYINPKLNDHVPYLTFNKEEIKEFCHLVRIFFFKYIIFNFYNYSID
jgi:hypothetical protein